MLAGAIYSAYSEATAGISFGEPMEDPLASVWPLGVNVSLEQYGPETLRSTIYPLIRKGGFRWMRQAFLWAEIEPQPGQFNWEPWDLIVESYLESGAALIAVLDTSPAWARDEPYLEAPPRDFNDYFRFVQAFVERYKDKIDFYQIWDEPNIYPHWGERFIDPRGYVNLLRGAYVIIKERDPQAVVLSAGLAPNVEAGGRNMSDLRFLEEMYRAGARKYFDILAIQPYGFWEGPEARADPNITNFSRALLLREIAVKYRDEAKPIWAVEFGWNALAEEWTGAPSPWSSDHEEVQARRTVQALDRAMDKWPWMGAMLLMHLQPDAPADDPVWGFSLLSADYSPRLTYREVARWAQDLPLFPGYYQLDVVGPGELWGLRSVREATVDLNFKGTRLDLIIHLPFRAQVKIDDQSFPALSLIDGTGERRVTVADALPYAEHTLQLTVAEPDEAEVAGIIVRRDFDFTPLYLSLSLLGITTVIVSWRLARLAVSPAIVAFGERIARPIRALPESAQYALTGSVLLIYYFSPWLPLDLLALVALFFLVYILPDVGLFYLVLSVPFYLLPKGILGKHFSLVETLTLIAFATWVLRQWLLPGLRQWSIPMPGLVSGWAESLRDALRSFNGMDWAVLFFLAVSVLSLEASEVLEVSLREFRVVILEPVLFYWLLRQVPRKQGQFFRLLDAFILSAIIISLYGLFQYFFTADVITAEGVRRMRAVYGSPNNLALFLGRAIPMALAVVLWHPESRRRQLYALGLMPVILAVFLTFSRGALFLGVSAAVLFLAAMKSRKALAMALGLVLVAMVLLIPLTGLERFSSLLNLESGTGFLRLQLWAATVDMLRDHPITGVGLDNFLYQYPRYIRPGAEIEPDLSHPHNLLLHWWVSLGVLGVVALIWMLIAFFRMGFRLLLGVGQESRTMLLGLMGTMVYILAHGLVDQSYFLVDLAFVFFLCLGILRNLSARSEDFS